jgi:hypothetical protein
MKKKMEWSFYYRYGAEEKVEWGKWKTLWGSSPFSLRIVIGESKELPEIRVDPSNPRIEWKKTLPNKKKGERRFELPSLYHVPVKGARFRDLQCSDEYRLVMDVVDHGMNYRLKEEETNQQKLRELEHDELCIENRRAKEEWMKEEVAPSWETWYQEDNLSHQFFLYSQTMGEWVVAANVLDRCDWCNGEEKAYYRAIVEDHRRCRMTRVERNERLRDDLWACSAFPDAWLQLVRLYDTNPHWDRDRLKCKIMESILILGKQQKITEEMLSIYSKILDVSMSRWLFPSLLRCKNKDIRHRVIQRMIASMPFITQWDGAEKGAIQFSPDTPDFVASSSSLTIYPGNPRWYVVNVRRVNYRIMPNGSYISIVNGLPTPYYNGITKNEYYFMDRETLEPVSACFSMKEDVPSRREEERAIMGIEDVRLVPSGNDILFYGVTKEYSYMDAIRIIQGRYDIQRCLFTETTVIRPPYEENSCEKNWAFCGDHRYVYRWHPIEIGHVAKNDRLVIDEHMNSPPFFEEFRGSSPGIRWRGYDWFTTHSVSYVGGVRKYIHYIVVLDLDKKEVVGVTSPFGFESLEIEYTVGLDVNDRILFFYSTRDCTSRYVRLPLFSILEKMHYTGIDQQQRFQTRIFCIQK